MSFIRRKGNQVLLVHSERNPDTGKVEQRVLHRFPSPAELEAVLVPDPWKEWTRSIEWREPGIKFDWKLLKRELAVELATWIETSASGDQRHQRKVGRMVNDLSKDLAALTPARVADAEFIQLLRPSLSLLARQVTRLLQPVKTPTEPESLPPSGSCVAPPALRSTVAPAGSLVGASSSESPSAVGAIGSIAGKAVEIRQPVRKDDDEARQAPADFEEGDDPTEDPQFMAAEEIFDEGMEHWWEDDRAKACRLFRRALKVYPGHADALNHLGIAAMDDMKFSQAEKFFREAIKGGERFLIREKGKLSWGHLENRPFLRAYGNLAMAFEFAGKPAQALEVNKQYLKLDPDDGSGARVRMGQCHLALGDYAAALQTFLPLKAYDPGCAFGVVLAQLGLGASSADIGEAMLFAFASNRYVVPMMLGLPWTRIDGFHFNGSQEPDWADDIVKLQGPLWRRLPQTAEIIRFWWSSPPVAAWRAHMDASMQRLGKLRPGSTRDAELAKWESLVSGPQLKQLVAAVEKLS